MHRNPIGWFEIYVQDVDRARAFYERTFRMILQPLESPEVIMWAFPTNSQAPGCGGALVKKDEKESGIGGTIIYFTCADCSVEAARAEKAGGVIHRPKFSIGPYGFIAYVLDTEGNMIGLHSNR